LPKDIFPPSFFLVGQTEEKMKVDTPDVKSGGRKVRQINNKNKDPESKKKSLGGSGRPSCEFAKIRQTIVFWNACLKVLIVQTSLDCVTGAGAPATPPNFFKKHRL
jgi:hypothetical protein